jgi:hypothetical protein
VGGSFCRSLSSLRIRFDAMVKSCFPYIKERERLLNNHIITKAAINHVRLHIANQISNHIMIDVKRKHQMCRPQAEQLRVILNSKSIYIKVIRVESDGTRSELEVPNSIFQNRIPPRQISNIATHLKIIALTKPSLTSAMH